MHTISHMSGRHFALNLIGDVELFSSLQQCWTSQVGDEVRCKAIPNLDGGQYAWRCIEVEVRHSATDTCSWMLVGASAWYDNFDESD